MTLKKDDIEQELECYTKIINLFSNISKDPINLETYKDHAIIKAMNALKDPKNETWLRNALVVLLSLFNGNPADLYSNLGNNIRTISEIEKADIFSKLKKEVSLKKREKRFNDLLRKIKDH